MNFKKKKIKFGFGTYGIGEKKTSSFSSEKSRINFLKKVYEKGVFLFDTAEEYHNGFSEYLLGKAFKKNDEVVIATKISPINYKKNILQSIDKSLRRLDRDYIDIIQLHWPNYNVDDLKIIESLYEAMSMKKIKYVGLCNVTKKYLDRFLRLSMGKLKIKIIQNEYNLFERSVEEDLLNFCKKKKINFLAYSPFGSSKQVKKIFSSSRIKNISKLFKLKPSQVILQWLNHNGAIPIFQTSNLSNLKENTMFDSRIIPKDFFEKINNEFEVKVIRVLPSEIKIVESFSGKFYTNIEQAKKNNYNFSPSPNELAKEIKENDILKPIKLKKTIGGYSLYEGQLRYWGWVIAYGNNFPIEAIIE